MAEFIKIATVAELPPEGEAKEFVCEGRTVCVANANGKYSAMDNVCPHRGGPLSQGVVDGDKLICPWHGWSFNVRTGESVQRPSTAIPTYGLKIDGDDVLIEIKQKE